MKALLYTVTALACLAIGVGLLVSEAFKRAWRWLTGDESPREPWVDHDWIP